jgi:hypothetical protein
MTAEARLEELVQALVDSKADQAAVRGQLLPRLVQMGLAAVHDLELLNEVRPVRPGGPGRGLKVSGIFNFQPPYSTHASHHTTHSIALHSSPLATHAQDLSP